jgi:YfiR/HmsC-like
MRDHHLILSLLADPSFAYAQVNPPSEYQVKAAFLFNFVKCVDWPSATFSSDRSPIELCILGDDPFGNALDELIHGKTINAREIAIHRTKRVEELKTCHVVFISGSEDRRLPEVFDGLKDARALVVGRALILPNAEQESSFTWTPEGFVSLSMWMQYKEGD